MYIIIIFGTHVQYTHIILSYIILYIAYYLYYDVVIIFEQLQNSIIDQTHKHIFLK